MKNNSLFAVLVLSVCVIGFASLYGCGAAPTSGGGSAVGGNRVGSYLYSGTQSPGDVWSWLISTETFSGSCEVGAQKGVWVSGTWVTLLSGFGKATISNAGGPAGMTPPTDGSAHAYFLEFPNTMLLVKPEGDNDSRVMVCAASATLEPNAGRYIYVNIPEASWESGSPAYGTVETSQTSPGYWHFDMTSYLFTGEVFGSNHDNFFYSNGTFTCETTSDKTQVFMTPSNVFFGDSGPYKGGFAGAKYESMTTTEFSAGLNHTYKGVRFVYNVSSFTGETEPITCSKVATMDALLASDYSGGAIETGIPSHAGVRITFEASSVPGFYKGYAEQLGSGDPDVFMCLISRIGPVDNKKYAIAGFGIGGDGRPFNFLIIQTD